MTKQKNEEYSQVYKLTKFSRVTLLSFWVVQNLRWLKQKKKLTEIYNSMTETKVWESEKRKWKLKREKKIEKVKANKNENFVMKI